MKKKDYNIASLKNRITTGLTPEVLKEVTDQIEELNRWSANEYQSTEDLLMLKILSHEISVKRPANYPREEKYRFSWGTVVETQYAEDDAILHIFLDVGRGSMTDKRRLFFIHAFCGDHIEQLMTEIPDLRFDSEGKGGVLFMQPDEYAGTYCFGMSVKRLEGFREWVASRFIPEIVPLATHVMNIWAAGRWHSPVQTKRLMWDYVGQSRHPIYY